MATLSDSIEKHIKELLNGSKEESVELNRAHLAQHFSCVPSQINYVLSTRFSKERGFIIESRRGGGGYIRVVRIERENLSLEGILAGIHGGLTLRELDEALLAIKDLGLIGAREAQIIRGIIQQETLGLAEETLQVRSCLLRSMLYLLLYLRT